MEVSERVSELVLLTSSPPPGHRLDAPTTKQGSEEMVPCPSMAFGSSGGRWSNGRSRCLRKLSM